MANTMAIKDIIDSMSELYRAELRKGNDLKNEYSSIAIRLIECEKNLESVTVAEYERLKKQRDNIELEKKLQEKYCDGIFEARELLMRLKFNTVVK